MAIRLHLTSADIANIRLQSELSPLAEASDAVRNHVVLRQPVPAGLDRDKYAMVREVAGYTGCRPGFTTYVTSSVDGALEQFMATTRQQIADDLDDVAASGRRPPRWAAELLEARATRRVELAAAFRHVYEKLVSPYEQVRATHQLRDHEARTKRLATHGIGAVLNSLHPAIRWTAPVLEVEIQSPVDFDVQLEGAGLLLVPSWNGGWVGVAHDSRGAFGTSVSYPLTLPAAQRDGSAGSASSHAVVAALGPVVGQTRARVLVQLRDQPGAATTRVATLLDISPATASENLTALHAAGLVQRERRGPSVLHSLTRAGWALVTASGSVD